MVKDKILNVKSDCYKTILLYIILSSTLLML